MARISKSGLDYFPLDVNFLQDRKVRRISSRHQSAGIAALTSLFCLIYKEKGFYVAWNQDTLFDIAQESYCKEEEMQAIIDDCLSVGLFDTYIYKEYGVLTSQAIQEQYHKIITDSRRRNKLPAEIFWLIKEEPKEGNDKMNDKDKMDAEGINAAITPEYDATMPQTKQEMEMKARTEKERESKSKRENDIETEIEAKSERERIKENEMPNGASNGVLKASPVAVNGLSFNLLEGGGISERGGGGLSEGGAVAAAGTVETASGGVTQSGETTQTGGVTAGGTSETLLMINLKNIGIHSEKTVKGIFALAQRREIGGPGGIIWKILSSEYRSTLLKKNNPGDYILWALNHPVEFEETYTGTLKKMIRGR